MSRRTCCLLLSICIATRNRLVYLIETIDSILPQLVPGVEIVIVDGASSDGTYEYFAVAFVHPAIRYVRLEKNGGLDQDYDLAVQHAIGEYCWLLSDDDLLKADALLRVLSEIGNETAVVIVDAEVMDVSLKHVHVKSRLRLDEKLRVRGDRRDYLLSKCGDHLTFIGGLVARRDLWLSRERSIYYGSYFLHFSIVFQADFPGEAVVLPGPVVSIRSGNESWTSRTFEIWNILWPQIVWNLDGISPHVKRKVVPEHPWRSTVRLVKFRALGAYSVNEYRSFIKTAPNGGWFKVIAWFIAVVPGEIFNTLGIVIASLFMRDNPQALQDVKNSRFNIWRTSDK